MAAMGLNCGACRDLLAPWPLTQLGIKAVMRRGDSNT